VAKNPIVPRVWSEGYHEPRTFELSAWRCNWGVKSEKGVRMKLSFKRGVLDA